MPKPPYPANARKQGIEGTVRVSITLDENGNIVGASIVSCSHPLLNDPSIESAMRRGKYRPGPRATRIIPIRFTLN